MLFAWRVALGACRAKRDRRLFGCHNARMTARAPTIVATSIGFWPAGHGEKDWRLGPAYGVAASLARAGDSPRVCLVGTAIGDAGDELLAMYAAFGRAGWRVSRLAIHALIGAGTLPDGYATDNGTGLIFERTELVDCVTEVDGARTWKMTRRPDGTVDEVPLPTRLLSC
jgi:hypothetical protein